MPMPTRVAVTCFAAVIALTWSAAAQEPSPHRSVAGRPLLEVLREHAASAPVDLRVDPAVADRLVDVSIDGLDIESALKRALLASGVDFVMVWKGGRLQVLAGDLHAAVDMTRRGAGVTAPAGPEPRVVELESEPVASSSSDQAPAPPAPEAERGAAAPDFAPTAGEGSVTGAQMLALLTAPVASSTTRNSASIELPFTDAAGQPVRLARPAETPGAVQLPFTDETGQPVVQIGPARPPGVIELPLPDEFGRPIRIAPPAAPRKSPPGDE